MSQVSLFTSNRLQEQTAESALPASSLHRMRLVEILKDGLLKVKTAEGRLVCCDCLEAACGIRLTPGDELLVSLTITEDVGVVVGRISRYTPPQSLPKLILEATESLTLKCGEAQVDLRADGQVVVKGEDVLLRAKGTQRIRAGTVAIN